MILVHYTTELYELELENFTLSLKNSNFSYIAYCQGGKTISSIQKFDRPSCSSCRLCTAWILDPATKTNNCFLCKQIVFLEKVQKYGGPKDFLCASPSKITECMWQNPHKSLVLFSKSEQFYGLGAGLGQSNKLNNINCFMKAKTRILYIQYGQFWFLNNIVLNILQIYHHTAHINVYD